jgi:Flp pilus assembly protein TadB
MSPVNVPKLPTIVLFLMFAVVFWGLDFTVFGTPPLQAAGKALAAATLFYLLDWFIRRRKAKRGE